MAINKETKSFGMPWEKEYGYSQAVKVGDTIYLSGQVSHDYKGDIVGLRDMEAQMRQAYTNIQKLLAQYGATMDNVVDGGTLRDRYGRGLRKQRSNAGGNSFQALLLSQALLYKFSVLRFLSS